MMKKKYRFEINKLYQWFQDASADIVETDDLFEIPHNHYHLDHLYAIPGKQRRYVDVPIEALLDKAPYILRKTDEFFTEHDISSVVPTICCQFEETTKSEIPDFITRSSVIALSRPNPAVCIYVNPRIKYRAIIEQAEPMLYQAVKMTAPEWFGSDFMVIYSRSLFPEFIAHGIEFFMTKEIDYFPWPIGEIVGYKDAIEISEKTNMEHK